MSKTEGRILRAEFEEVKKRLSEVEASFVGAMSAINAM